MSESNPTLPEKPQTEPQDGAVSSALPDQPEPEQGGRGGLDPVRYGDWEKDGRCIDF